MYFILSAYVIYVNVLFVKFSIKYFFINIIERKLCKIYWNLMFFYVKFSWGIIGCKIFYR